MIPVGTTGPYWPSRSAARPGAHGGARVRVVTATDPRRPSRLSSGILTVVSAVHALFLHL
ncbi:hypothetical protein [Streptomyces spiralis]|uniref:hypothetical protein n=1 Tax=Streptomyces spiralis TaxID=66376 RepID=UPI0036C9BDE9